MPSRTEHERNHPKRTRRADGLCRRGLHDLSTAGRIRGGCLLCRALVAEGKLAPLTPGSNEAVWIVPPTPEDAPALFYKNGEPFEFDAIAREYLQGKRLANQR